jgi:predicted permease
MRAFTVLRLRLQSLFQRARVDQELDDELQYHLERDIEERVNAGMDPGEARRVVRRMAAGLVQRKEECRDMRGVNVFDNLIQDTRFAVRQLRKALVFTAAAIFTLALGIAASVAIFAFVDAALIRPLPYHEPSRLVGVYETVKLFPRSNLSYQDYLDWKKLNTVFTSLAAYQGGGVQLGTAGGVERAPGARVSDDFFRTLGVAPVMGRDFRPGEDLPAAPRTVILSYTAWHKRYGGASDVVGRTISINGNPTVIVGVLPAEFHFAPVGSPEFWTTLHPAANSCDARRSCHNLYGIARLNDGATAETAMANVKAIAAQLEQQYPDSNRGQGATVATLTDVIVGRVRPILLVLLGGAGLLLVIAAVNVASLILVRSESRRREIAVRRALGASARRVVAQFVTEGVVLVGVGAVVGVLLAMWAMQLLTALVPANLMAGMPYLQDLGLNARVLTFAVAVALLATVLFAVTPILHLSLSRTQSGLTEGSRGTAGNTWRRVGSRLVVFELATAMILLVGAALLGQSLYRLLHVDVGLQADHLATLGVALPAAKYSTNEQQAAFQRRIVDEIATLPGVQSVGVTSTPPLAGGNTVWIRVDGRPYHGEHNEVQYRDVSPSYFATLGARLVRGRQFRADEDASKPPVVIINQTMARQYFPGEDPLGKRLLYAPTTTAPAMEIVGIVDDIKEGPLDSVTNPTMYVVFEQDPSTGFVLVARTAGSDDAMLPTLTAAIHQIDSDVSTFFGSTMTRTINTSPAAYLRRSSAALVGGFAAVAWLLGVIGFYGVVAYSVSQRTREIGVRMALGAERRTVHRLILGEAGRLTVVGIVLGLLGSVAAAALMGDVLFGVRSWDVPTLAAVASVLALSALVASYVPARRAAAVNPVDALRAE